jgi:hypothetical protein
VSRLPLKGEKNRKFILNLRTQKHQNTLNEITLAFSSLLSLKNEEAKLNGRFVTIEKEDN